jgi:hypothetical protein
MSTLKERVEEEIADWERLSGKKKAQIFLEKIDSSDVDICRLIVIGGFVITYFPELLRLTPQKTEVENEIEFSPLISFFILLGNRRNLLDRLMKKAY